MRKVIDKQSGFTLIELLIVIGILAILLAITLVALNPRQNFQQANNTQRQSDVNAILNAIDQYAANNKGQLPTGIDATVRYICTDTSKANCATGKPTVDLCAALTPTYIADLPTDPSQGSKAGATCSAGVYDTEYTVVSTGSTGANRVTVAAPDAELSQTITVTR